MWHDTMVVFRRAMRISLRNPVWVILGLSQPLLYLALFGPLLRNLPLAGEDSTAAENWRIFVPGLLVQLGIFGAAFVGFGLVGEWRAGVIERMRVSPASRVALLLGRVMRDVIVIVVQATLLTIAAIPFGLRVNAAKAVLAIVLVGLLGAAFSSLSYTAALKTKSEDALAPLLNGIAIPLLLLSGILLPMSLAPGWLQALADANPLSHVVTGVRALFATDGDTGEAVGGAVATVALVVVGMVLGTRAFRREAG